jgi:NAD(P)-dependent dehydrogenase (short-subunit alcohol dehydrogenase family)
MTQPVCVIVGAGPGNGAAFAGRFAGAGHPVALLARDPSGLASLAAEIPGTRAFACDATDATQVEAAFARIRAELGPVGVLVYNASTRGFADFELDLRPFGEHW